ncbi:MAG: hypothetical protein IJJ42_07110 [Clostridia bacterium]|nr:hypothetical protein [Clostridia bacterium]
MYKLLLVTDREEVLNAFNQIQNWEMLGFKPPHIRHDFEGAKDSLAKHHADGIAIALDPAEERLVLNYLQERFPLVSIFEAGKSPEEVLRYLTELKSLLNRVRADFSNDSYEEIDMLQVCRHDFLGKVMNRQIPSRDALYRNMRLLRSRLDPERPCLLMELEQVAIKENRLEGRWTAGKDRLELTLRNSFGPDLAGMHIVPSLLPDGRIQVLACPFKGATEDRTPEEMRAILNERANESIEHLKEYKGLELRLTDIQILPALTALCE